MIRKVFSLLIITGGLIASICLLFGVYIDHNEVGVRYFYKGNHRGIALYILLPGITWRIPFVCSVQKLPSNPQRIILRNSLPRGPNPHRNALFMPGSKRTYQNVIITFELNPNAALDYALSFWDIPPHTIVEGYIRTCALSIKDDFESLKDCANDRLKYVGLRVLDIRLYQNTFKFKSKPMKRLKPLFKGNDRAFKKRQHRKNNQSYSKRKQKP